MSSSSASDSYLGTNNNESDTDFTQEDLNDIEEVFNNDAEPLATEDEARSYAEEVAREQQQQQAQMQRFRSEVSLNSWCKCSYCSLDKVVNMAECCCCTEIEECSQRVNSYVQDHSKRVTCITEHPGFNEVCLNEWVLDVAGLGLKTKNGKRYTTLFNQGSTSKYEFYRAVSYRQYIRFVYGHTGYSKRYPLPCCAYNAIRKRFTSPKTDDHYHGYESGDDD